MRDILLRAYAQYLRCTLHGNHLEQILETPLSGTYPIVRNIDFFHLYICIVLKHYFPVQPGAGGESMVFAPSGPQSFVFFYAEECFTTDYYGNVKAVSTRTLKYNNSTGIKRTHMHRPIFINYDSSWRFDHI